MTASSNHNTNDADLHRLLSQAIRPDEFTDAQIEQLLADTSASELDDRQASRILTSTEQLIHESQQFTPANRLRKRRNNTTRPTEIVMKRIVDNPTPHSRQRGAVVALAVASVSLVAVLMATTSHSLRTQSRQTVVKQRRVEAVQNDWMTARSIIPVSVERTQVGDTVETNSNQRRRLALPDRSILFVNTGTQAIIESPRHVHVTRGEVFVEVVPQFDAEQRTPFEVTTPQRTVTALGTKFSVSAAPQKTDVLVTQGKVKVSGQPAILKAGQQLTARGDSESPTTVESSPRASAALDWTRDLICAAVSILPDNQYAGGAIITVDPSGQEMKLSLRKYHIDVHIEDGFARTTIDQTYFNHTSSRLEGTFHFPLPADASLSRLAMYVNGKLMEGGMAERQHARNTFEQIVSKMKDPALLEWVDGSTFKMRVFPLEPRQEKRIVLSYTQRLNTAYGKTSYRFPAGHNMDVVRDWSTQVRIKSGSEVHWSSPSHQMTSSVEADDLLLESSETNSRMDRDLVLEWKSDEMNEGDTVWSTAKHEGHRYLMLRHHPALPAKADRQRRNWIMLFEASADRDPLLARTQLEIIRTILDNAEHTDTFNIVAANTQTKAFQPSPVTCTASNIKDAVEFMERTHLIGALDLKQAFVKSATFVSDQDVENILIHTGSALPVLGENRQHALLKKLPQDTAYVGVGVGKGWSLPFMKQAASKTGGYFTQINPDEDVVWRAFELSSTLNAPRLLDVNITADTAADAQPFHTFADTVVHGEEICAVVRLDLNATLPKSVTLNGMLNQSPWQKKLVVRHVQDDATYLPRTWAKLAIDSWVASDSAAHKDDIIELSKSMYVMSPYTSLLVLEDEAMYAQYGVDRGRKDHWALYPCPDEITVVHEPLERGDAPTATDHSDETTRLLKTITSLRAPTPQPNTNHMFGEIISTNGYMPIAAGAQLLGIEPGSSLPWGIPAYPPQLGLPQVSLSDNPREFRWTPRFSVPTSGSLGEVSDIDGETMQKMLGAVALRVGPSAIPVPVKVRQLELSQRSLNFSLHELLPLTSTRPGAVPEPVHELSFSGRNGVLHNDFSADLYWTQRADQQSLPTLSTGMNINGVEPRRKDLRFYSRTVPDDFYATFDGQPIPRPQLQISDQDERLKSNQQLITQLSSPTPPRELESLSLYYDYPTPTLPLGWQNATVKWRDGVWAFRTNNTPDNWVAPFGSTPILDFARGYDFLLPYGLPNSFARPQTSATSRPLAIPANSFCDLISHAPGMNTTWADVLNVLDTESAEAPGGRGSRRAAGSSNPAQQELRPPMQKTVDKSAIRLINRARSTQWEIVTLPTPDAKPPLTVTCNGEGHYTWTRIVSEGLEEQVVCDGDTLLHLYPEIGLGARRTYSRFHAETIRSLIPWLLPTAEELAHDFDIVKVDDNTVGLIPHSSENRVARAENSAPPVAAPKNDTTQGAPELMIHLLFDESGRLTEKQLLDRRSADIVQCVKFANDGTVTLLGKDGNIVTEQQWKRRACDAPNLSPSLDQLVVLPLPYRTVEFDNKTDDPLHKLASNYSEGHERKVVQIIRDDFFAKGDRREGFYVLLSRFPRFLTGEHSVDGTDGRKVAFDLRPSAEGSALQQFVRQWINLQLDYSDARELDVAAPDDSFLHRVATARNFIARWKSGIATNDRTKAQIRTELDRTITFIDSCRSEQTNWTILTAVYSSLPLDKFGAEFAAAAKAFEHHAGLKFLVRQERARALFRTGRTKKARRIVRRMLRDQIQTHGRPYLDIELRNLYVSNDGQKSWDRFVRSVGKQMIDSQQLRTAIWFSGQLHGQGDSQLAEDLVTQVLAAIQIDKRPEIAILASRSLQKINSASANELIDRVLEVESLQKSPELLRYASEVADAAGQKQTALKRLEQAVLLELEQQSDVVNLKTIRASYSKLMNRFEEVIDASATLQLPSPEELVARIVRAADQWRSIDDDDTQCCRMTAELLRKLNRRDLAWAYLTCPLANSAGEAGSWKTLAEELAKANEFELADLAWDRACNLQRTNPDLLLKHAELHRIRGNRRKSQRLLRQIINGDWQPRFSSTVQRARGLVR